MSASIRISIVVIACLCVSRAAPAADVAPVPTPAAVARQNATGSGNDVRETWSRTFKTGPQGALELWNLAGDVTIVGGSGDAIQVEAVKRLHRGSDRAYLDRLEIRATESPGRVRIRTVFPEAKNVAAEVEFHVTVPAGTTVTVQTISGDIQVDKVTGDAEAESVSGDVTITGARRLVRVKSVSGDVTVTDAAGETLEANSVSGDVQLRGLKAKACSLQTVSGSVNAQGAACERAEMRSVSGDVDYAGSLSPGGRYEFKSHSGDVRLSVGSGTGFSVTASTFSGSVSSQLQLTNVTRNEQSRHGPRNERLQGTFGDGSAQVMVTTFSGSVVLTGGK